MAYNPDVHRRRSIRLPHFDYTCAGAYFVTICTYQRECLFGTLINGTTCHNEFGKITHQRWHELPEHFENIALDQFVVMPNHIHGIIILNDVPPTVGATHASSVPKPRPIGTIVGSFKSAVSRQINAHRNTQGKPVWQRNYYEHIIRGDRDLAAVRKYIADNPTKWTEDENYPERLL